MTPSVQTRVRRREPGTNWRLEGEVCVVGSGIAGISAALEAARLGREVVLVEGAPFIGGQAVGAPIGTIAGLFSCGQHPHQLTHLVADELLAALERENAVYRRYSKLARTVVLVYDEVVLGRWIEREVQRRGIRAVTGALLREVRREGTRIRSLFFLTRFGELEVTAPMYIDASGDAAVAWFAGLPCREPDRPIYGSQMAILEGVQDEVLLPEAAFFARLQSVLQEKGDRYGLERRDGLVFLFPGRGMAIVNMTHVQTPLDPEAFTRGSLEGKDQVDRAIRLLREEFPEAFGKARVRVYGQLGIRQTRWIVGRYQLSAEDVRTGRRFEDAIARTAWPIELHDRVEGYSWEPFEEGHVHYVPLRSLIPEGVENLLAVGRCIDADPLALSSVRVMGPCIAMGAAAAHVTDLCLRSAVPVPGVSLAALRERLRANLEDPPPPNSRCLDSCFRVPLK
ncbi:MAG: FAD-dependent oxidoreductase [Armatimonadetes bacterium]|nr:FAD-dependent oxidoreductase [Armatimonadota bacterium]MDW8153937.1 FAD-dependent oxidoreductase [Armatimonadota bacterium]